MKNELQRHKKSDSVKWALTAIAFILVAVLLVGLCLQVFGNGKLKPSEWFKKSENIENTEQQSAVRLSTMPIAEEDYDAYGISPQSESAVIITASVLPENATNKRLTWSMAWTDTSTVMNWSYNKNVNDYVALSISEDTLSATLSSRQPFADTIRLTVAWEVNTAVQTNVNIGYKQKVEDVSLQLSTYRIHMNTDATFTGTVELSSFYSQPAQNLDYSLYLALNTDFYSALQSSGYGVFQSKRISFKDIVQTSTGFTKSFTLNDKALVQLFGERFLTEPYRTEFLNVLGSFNSSAVIATLTVTDSIGTTFTKSFDFGVEESVIRNYVAVNSVSSNDSTIMF